MSYCSLIWFMSHQSMVHVTSKVVFLMTSWPQTQELQQILKSGKKKSSKNLMQFLSPFSKFTVVLLTCESRAAFLLPSSDLRSGILIYFASILFSTWHGMNPKIPLPSSIYAALTICHAFISHNGGGWKFKFWPMAEFMSGKDPLLGCRLLTSCCALTCGR